MFLGSSFVCGVEIKTMTQRMELFNRDSFVWLTEVPDKSVDMVLTDPPYDFDMGARNFLQYHFMRISRGAVVVFSPPENQWQLSCDQWLFWVKPISTKNTSKTYSRFVEMIQVWNGETWNADRHWSQYTNVFTDLVNINKMHPFAKPLPMLERLLQNHSETGAVILDPFMGSGSTGLACKRTGRSFIGNEKNAEYFNHAVSQLTRDSDSIAYSGDINHKAEVGVTATGIPAHMRKRT
jgi:DNA modification methylase